MSQNAPSPHALRVVDLSANREARFEIIPDGATCSELASELGLDGLRKLRFTGTLTPKGKADWQLTAHLGATVVQPCGVTLAPVTTRIEEAVSRHYMSRPVQITDDEMEMPQDDQEPLGPWIDPWEVMIESLSLSIPMYPRAANVQAGPIQAAPPGTAPLQDADLKPFASLQALRDKMDK
jgi:uncharacterized metal-binding protein YceD (DUF177 family)